MPRARRRDTPAYEWSMIHRDTRRRGIVQIKTGSTPVDLNELAAAVTDDSTDTFEKRIVHLEASRREIDGDLQILVIRSIVLLLAKDLAIAVGDA